MNMMRAWFVLCFWQTVQSEINKIFVIDIAVNPLHFELGLDSSFQHRYRYILELTLQYCSISFAKNGDEHQQYNVI